MSLFVNPAQFDDADDLAAYPRDEERDAALAAEAGADMLFAPAAEESTRPASRTEVARRAARSPSRSRAPTAAPSTSTASRPS